MRALDAQGREVGRAAFDFGARVGGRRALRSAGRIAQRGRPPRRRRRTLGRRDLAGRRALAPARVAIASGASADVAQPLLAPSYYLKRALQPFADVREWHDSSTDPDRLAARREALRAGARRHERRAGPGPRRDHQFVDNGGVLLRFAGSRLAAGDDDLTPTALRRGGRLLGGALSWETPKHIAPFEAGSPFFGLAAPEEVTVSRQVLAEPEPGTCREDLGAPRRRHAARHRRAARQGPDRAVPRHRRHDLVEPAALGPVRRHAAPDRGGSRRARRQGAAKAKAASTRRWPPWRTLDGFGVLGPPPPHAEPIGADFSGAGDAQHPPGFYGPPEFAARRQCAGRRARRWSAPTIGPLDRARGRACDRAADRSAPLAPAGRSGRPADRRAGFALAHGRRALAPRKARRRARRSSARSASPPFPPQPRAAEAAPISDATWTPRCRRASPMS